MIRPTRLFDLNSARHWAPSLMSSTLICQAKSPVKTLDRIDISILVELQKDGRMTNADLAESANLSPSACLRRVQMLEASGV